MFVNSFGDEVDQHAFLFHSNNNYGSLCMSVFLSKMVENVLYMWAFLEREHIGSLMLLILFRNDFDV